MEVLPDEKKPEGSNRSFFSTTPYHLSLLFNISPSREDSPDKQTVFIIRYAEVSGETYNGQRFKSENAGTKRVCGRYLVIFAVRLKPKLSINKILFATHCSA